MKVIGVHMDRCTGCKTCELYCGAERGSEGKTLLKAVQETPAPQPRVRVEGGRGRLFPLQCRHCLQAPCLDACLTGALTRDAEERHGDHPRGPLHRMLDLYGLLSLRGDLPLAGEEDRRSSAIAASTWKSRSASTSVRRRPWRWSSSKRSKTLLREKRRKTAKAMAADGGEGFRLLDLGR